MLRKRVSLLLILIFVVGCAAFQQAKEQPFTTWSAKKKMTYAMNVYKAEYDKYMVSVVRPDLTEGQKEYLRQKRVALVGLDKTIQSLIPVVELDGQVPPNLESELIMFLNQLGVYPM